MNKKVGDIEFIKGGWQRTSETILFPRYFHNVWIVSIPILKSELKKGNYTTGLGFYNEWDAKTFSTFLKVHMRKYIKEANEQ